MKNKGRVIAQFAQMVEEFGGRIDKIVYGRHAKCYVTARNGAKRVLTLSVGLSQQGRKMANLRADTRRALATKSPGAEASGQGS